MQHSSAARQLKLHLSNPKLGHTTGGSGCGAVRQGGGAERGRAGQDADGMVRPGDNRPSLLPGRPANRRQMSGTILRKHEQTKSYVNPSNPKPGHTTGGLGRGGVRSISEISSCFVGPRLWHFEVRHRAKKASTINLFGFEIFKLKVRRLKLWKPTVRRGGGVERGLAGQDADGVVRPGDNRLFCAPALPGHRRRLS